MNKEKIGQFIASCRKENGWTQEELAEKLFVDRATISKWERGIYIPNNELLLKLQELFNVSINEILFGEKRNNTNNDKIDIIPINIMNEGKRKIKKILLTSISIIIILIVSFFIYYFINNYNSIKVYKILGSNDEFVVDYGIMISSREKCYIKLGKIKKKKNIDIYKVKLYFIKNNEENIIFESSEDDIISLLQTEFSSSNPFKYSDINSFINNLYLEITDTDSQSYILKLNLIKDFSNDKFFNFSNNNSLSLDDNTDVSYNVPDYIMKNFKFADSQGRYYNEIKNEKCTLTDEYFYQMDIYDLIIDCGTTYELYSYSNYYKNLNYYFTKDGKVVNKFTYNYANNICRIETCDNEKINNFKKTYLDHIFD